MHMYTNVEVHTCNTFDDRLQKVHCGKNVLSCSVALYFGYFNRIELLNPQIQ